MDLTNTTAQREQRMTRSIAYFCSMESPFDRAFVKMFHLRPLLLRHCSRALRERILVSSTIHIGSRRDSEVKDEDLVKEVKFIEKRLKDLQEDAATLLKKMVKEPKKNSTSNRSTRYWKFLKEIQDIDEQTPTVRVDIKDIKERRMTGDEDGFYRLGMDYPGFHPEDIRVTLMGNLLKIEATKENGKDHNYVYEHDFEELLPKEAIMDKLTAYFDAQNFFLIIEVPLQPGTDLSKVEKEAKELNKQLRKKREQEKKEDV